MAHGVFTDVAPLYTESGSVSGAVGTSTDVTDCQRAEAELRQAHHKLQSALNSITDGPAALDQNRRYTYFSKQGARIIGMRREKLLRDLRGEVFRC